MQTPSSTEARLSHIESELRAMRRSARRWKIAACTLPILAVTLGAAMQEGVPHDLLRAKRLEIVGPDDKVVVALYPDDVGGRVDLWSAGGMNTVRLSGSTYGGDVAVWNATGQPAAALFAAPRGGRVEVNDADGTPLAKMERGEAGGALVLSGPGDTSANLRAEAGPAGAVMCMRRPDGGVGLQTGVAQGAGVLSMFNNAGKEVFFAGDTEDHSGALRLADAAGNQTIALTSRGGGGVLVKDGAGNPVASLASAGAGRGGVFEVLNGQGNPALSLDTNATGGGRMVVSTAGGNPAVVADAGNAGGTVSTYLSDRRVAAMGATETGGVINLLDLNGQVVVSAGMSSDGVGGVVSTRNLRGVSVTRLGVDGVSSGELAVFNSTGTHKKVISAPVPGKTP